MRAELKHSRWLVFVLTPPEDPLRFHRQHQMASDPLELFFLSMDIERDYETCFNIISCCRKMEYNLNSTIKVLPVFENKLTQYIWNVAQCAQTL